MNSAPLVLAQATDVSPPTTANETVNRLDMLNHPEERHADLASLHNVGESSFVAWCAR